MCACVCGLFVCVHTYVRVYVLIYLCVFGLFVCVRLCVHVNVCECVCVHVCLCVMGGLHCNCCSVDRHLWSVFTLEGGFLLVSNNLVCQSSENTLFPLLIYRLARNSVCHSGRLGTEIKALIQQASILKLDT